MKKGLIIGILFVAVFALATVGYAYAQGAQPTNAQNGAQGGYGMMGGGFGAGMMGTARGTGDELLHDYYVQAFADATGLSVQEIEDRLYAGETLSEIALTLGYTSETFPTLLGEVRAAALAAAVTDGVITQEQADWMLSRMTRMWQGMAGAGAGRSGSGCPMRSGSTTSTTCPMYGNGRWGGMGMWGAGACLQNP